MLPHGIRAAQAVWLMNGLPCLQPEGEEDVQSPWEMYDINATPDDLRDESPRVQDDIIARCMEAVERLEGHPRYADFAVTPKPSQRFNPESGTGASIVGQL